MATAQGSEELDKFFSGQGWDLDGKAIFNEYFRQVRILWQARDELHYEYPASLAMLRTLRCYVSGLDAVRLTASVMIDGFGNIIAAWKLYPDALCTLAATPVIAWAASPTSTTATSCAASWSVMDCATGCRRFICLKKLACASLTRASFTWCWKIGNCRPSRWLWLATTTRLTYKTLSTPACVQFGSIETWSIPGAASRALTHLSCPTRSSGNCRNCPTCLAGGWGHR
jgi:hypothetical protein